MSFGTTYRIIALAPELVPVLFPALLEAYGDPVLNFREYVTTIGVDQDQTDIPDSKRPAIFPETIPGIPLTDGRVAFRSRFQTDLMAEFDENGLLGVEELTEGELAALLPELEGLP